MKIDKFPCDGCGKCCEAVNCTLYNPETKQCPIYENRPTICNVDKYIEENQLDKETFYKKNKKACTVLQKGI